MAPRSRRTLVLGCTNLDTKVSATPHREITGDMRRTKPDNTRSIIRSRGLFAARRWARRRPDPGLA